MVSIGACKPKKIASSPISGESASSDDAFENFYIDACTHFNNANYPVALKLFKKCAELKPQEASVYYQISRINYMEKNENEGLQNAMKANRLAPENSYYAQWYSRQLKLINNLEDAQKVLEVNLNLNPGDELITKDLDALYALQMFTDKRIDLWNNLIKSKGFKITYAEKLIGLYKLKKDYVSAHATYDEIKKAAPAKFKYYVEDGDLYLLNNDESNAFKNYEKALTLNPNIWNLNISLYRYYHKQKEYKTARTYIIQGFSDPYTAFDSKALVCAEINREYANDTAYSIYLLPIANSIASMYVNNSHAQLTAARFYELGKKPGDSYQCYSNSFNLLPNTYEAWIGAIRVGKSIRKPDDLGLLIDSALEYFPTTSELYFLAASNANSSGKWNNSIAYSNSGMSFVIEDTMKMKLLTEQGRSEFGLKNYDKAIKRYESAIAINISYPLLFECMGDALYMTGKHQDAINYWKKASDSGSNSQVLMKKIKEGKYSE